MKCLKYTVWILRAARRVRCRLILVVCLLPMSLLLLIFYLQTLPTMTGEPVKLHFKEHAEPHAVHAPIPVPHHWKQQIKDD